MAGKTEHLSALAKISARGGKVLVDFESPNGNLYIMKRSAYLYLAVPRGGERFKIGRSLAPGKRLRALGFNDLDLDHTRLLAGTPGHVAKAESVLHFMLEPWRSPHPDSGDGHTEWFTQEALNTALAYVTDLAVSDSRFTLSDPLELRTPARSSGLHAKKKAIIRERYLEGVNDCFRGMPDELEAMRRSIERLCQSARGVVGNAADGDAVLCFEKLSRETVQELASTRGEALFPAARQIMVPGQCISVIECGRWYFHNGRGAGMQTLHYGELARLPSMLARYREQDGVDTSQLDAAVVAAQKTSTLISQYLEGLPRLEGRWKDAFEVDHAAALAFLF